MNPKVSVIIVNYNGLAVVIDCLNSLERQSFDNFELIIVDNNSKDSSPAKITEYLEKSPIKDRAKFIINEANTGFTGGNITGYGHCAGQYIALLNNDTVTHENWLRKLVECMDARPDVGICASKMIVYGSEKLDSAGDGFSTILKGFKRGEGADDSAFDAPGYVLGACAGAALYRRKMLDEIGFLDDDFFLIQEDTDINLRAQLGGWKAYYVPEAVVWHKVRSSIGHLSDLAAYYSIRNCELVRIKNIPLVMFILCLPYFTVYELMEFYYFAVKHGRLSIFARAKLDVLANIGKTLAKRRLIMRNKKVPALYLYGISTSALQKDFNILKLKKLITKKE